MYTLYYEEKGFCPTKNLIHPNVLYAHLNLSRVEPKIVCSNKYLTKREVAN